MKMGKKKITVAVGSLEDMAQEAIEIWHQAEREEIPKNAPIEKIYFESARLLLKTLTPRRCDLLKCVHEKGAVSIRGLAKTLERDYSNVYHDVKELHHAGLIVKNEKDNKYYVPWETILTEIPLCTTSHTHNPGHNRNTIEHDVVHHSI